MDSRINDQLSLFEASNVWTDVRNTSQKQAAQVQAYFGCAGWSIPKQAVELFPLVGTHLQRYASVLRGVEINSSFYRPHRKNTYARWAESVPPDFRFAVKFPKEVTHDNRLTDPNGRVTVFLEECSGLGHKLGPLLVQLPPSLPFMASIAETFFARLRDRHNGHIVCEPRHPSWFEPDAMALLQSFGIARVGADPSVVPDAFTPVAASGVIYIRLHGSPVMYVSDYQETFLSNLAAQVVQWQTSNQVWVMFDNTSVGAAWYNAVDVQSKTVAALP